MPSVSAVLCVSWTAAQDVALLLRAWSCIRDMLYWGQPFMAAEYLSVRLFSCSFADAGLLYRQAGKQAAGT